MNSPLLEARDITKSYGRGSSRFTALDGVSLAVPAGEALAIVGKSGSGKSITALPFLRDRARMLWTPA